MSWDLACTRVNLLAPGQTEFEFAILVQSVGLCNWPCCRCRVGTQTDIKVVARPKKLAHLLHPIVHDVLTSLVSLVTPAAVRQVLEAVFVLIPIRSCSV